MFIPRASGVGPKKDFNLLEGGMFDDVKAQEAKAVGFMSGFTYFDYPTAYEDKDIFTGNILPNGGCFARIYSCIGESGTGKTTTMIQLGGSIVDRSINGNLVIIDAEGNTTMHRVSSLNQWTDSEFRKKCIYIPPSPPISINDVYNIIRKIAHQKDKFGDTIKYETPFGNPYTGKPIRIYPPTVVILDSVPALVISQTMEEAVNGKKDFVNIERISQNVDGMREAKDNTNFLRKIKGVLDEYNVILILVNHLSKEVAMGMFDKPKKFHPNLKAGEKLKGGTEQIYQSFGLFKMSQKEKIDERNPIYGDHIEGAIIEIEMIKNKSNVSGNAFRGVFDKRSGYRPELSDFEYLLGKKFGIEGSPMAMYLSILPEIKFTRKTLIDKCYEYPILSRAISFTAKYHMGNDIIIHRRFGDLDLKLFANMPFTWRMNIINTMTIPYPLYGLAKFSNEDLAEVSQLSYQGGIYTNLGDNYVSPCNIDKLIDITNMYDRGYCCPVYYDPVEEMINSNNKSK